MAPDLYWAKFTRTEINGRIDKGADASFLALNFTDTFGKWLQQGNNADLQSFDKVLMYFWKQSDSNNSMKKESPKNDDPPPSYTAKTFMAADASFLDKRPTFTGFSPHIRVISLITAAGAAPFSNSPAEFTICVVGGANLTSSDRTDGSFLQVASWDGLQCRFYQNDIIRDSSGKLTKTQGWNYFGNSSDAFGASSYLGPFNGHVNGTVIMKELHDPWIHWLNGGSGSSGGFDACFSQDNIKAFMAAPYITQPGQGVLSAVNNNPNDLEVAITNGVKNWFTTRQKWEFFDSTRSNLLPTPHNTQRWAAHLFLTTTINLAAAKSTTDGSQWIIDNNHFFDKELLSLPFLSSLLPKDNFVIQFTEDQYNTAVSDLGLSMIQELFLNPGTPLPPGSFKLSWRTLGGGGGGDDKIDFIAVSKNSEGPAPFNILQASLEDAQGVSKMQQLKKIAGTPPTWMGLFSAKVLNAIIMVDFWNPVYSWRRGVLMQYVPQTTTLVGQAYDLENNFIQNVRNSTFFRSQIKDSPEYHFIQLLDVDAKTHQANIANYFAAIRKHFSTDPVGALKDNLALAESRRRIYRPLPLDEFGYSMPYALNIPQNTVSKEMTADGTLVDMPHRGVDFLTMWTDALANQDPKVIPEPTNGFSTRPIAAEVLEEPASIAAPIAIQALPKPANLAFRCQAPTMSTPAPRMASAQSCPYFARANREAVKTEAAQSQDTSASTWTDDILPMMQSPYWLPEATRKGVGSYWITEMKKFSNLGLNNYDDVKSQCVTIYEHLRSKTMPLTDDPTEYWPEEALEKLRSWANAGFPKDKSDAPTPQTIIPVPIRPPPTYRVRKDIMSLSKEELAVYQSKIDDVLGAGQLGSKWQELGLLHAEWCLHYQEATFLWHRAHLRYVEELIDFPIPYWNGFAKEAANPDSPFAGLPRVFFEETYIHPIDGSTRPNPLKYALSLDGKSKQPPNRYVTRDPVLVAGNKDPGWKDKIDLFGKTYHPQIIASLSQATYTEAATMEGFGMPWANITTFSQDQPNSLYPYRSDFDGLFEQVHDNFHGWVGPDMSDNTYTAFDPIFLSFHCNMDRLVAKFIESHPENQFTSNSPLQPFQDDAKTLSYDDPRRWSYTTIGDMSKDTRALGYMFAVPASPDAYSPPTALERRKDIPASNGGKAITLPSHIAKKIAVTRQVDGVNGVNGIDGTGINGEKYRLTVPYIVFSNVGCTASSYKIDVYVKSSEVPGPNPYSNPDFIGQITRIGMGPGRAGGRPRNAGRCLKPTATRVLNAHRFATRIEKGKDAEESLSLVVTDLETGNVVGKDVYEELSGFEPEIVWLAD